MNYHKPSLIHKTLVFLTASLFLIMSCGQDDFDKISLDEQCGLYKGHGIEIETSKGLSKINSVEEGSIKLKLLAPHVDFHVTTDEIPPEWKISMENCMPDSNLSIAAGDEPFVIVQKTATKKKTTIEWNIILQPNSIYNLSIATEFGSSAGEFKLALLSDIQGTDNRDIYKQINSDTSIMFMVSAGDITEDGSLTEFDNFLKNIDTLEIPFYSAPGNHDMFSEPINWYKKIGSYTTHFTYKNVRFTFLDSSDETIDPTVYRWFNKWLDEGREYTHILVSHYPPFDPVGIRNGNLRSSAEGAKFVGMLADGKIDLALYGHIHTYHKYENAGILSYISGGGGGIQGFTNPFGRHYLVITADSSGIKNVELFKMKN